MKNLEINFKKVKDKIQNQITLWKPYNLSLKGRITIAKVKLISQLTYISTVLDINHTILNEIQEMINSFVMGIKRGGKHWISKDLLYTPTLKGGVSYTDSPGQPPEIGSRRCRRCGDQLC